MQAITYEGKTDVAVENVAEPVIKKATDAIIKVTSAAICGSDLHMYTGRTPLEPGKILGHEIMGVVEAIGEGVNQLKVGDRVVLPFNIGCGSCYNCNRGYTSACLIVNPENPGAGYGYAGMGPFDGGQAEHVLVPYADFNALKLPGAPNDVLENDFLMLADIFPTAWHATELAHVQMGSSVAIYGAGPVGLLAILSAQLKGASEIYVIDSVASRLDKAKQMGATPVDFTIGDPAKQIASLRTKNANLVDTQRPGEERRLAGVDCGIDAIGYQSHDFDNPDYENATQVLESLAQIVNPTGSIGLIGVYMPQDPGAPNADLQNGVFKIPLGMLWNKGISIGMGQCPVKMYNEQLRDLIIADKAHPGTIVTHEISITEAPDVYARFNNREAGLHKAVIKF